MKSTVSFLLLATWLGWGAPSLAPFDLEYPSHFPAPSYDFDNNPLDSSKVSLGRLLFYDPLLSKDNTISCASCHSPYNAFAHTDHALSHGIGDAIGTRNAPALFNLAWQTSFMWDGAIHHLDMQALAPISHAQEMGETLPSVLQKLQQSKRYPPLFAQAFGDSLVTGEHLLKALAQFQLTLVSATAKYDHVQQGLDSFNHQELQGQTLFMQHCNNCHTAPLFSSNTFANNGLPVDSLLLDYGKGMLSLAPKDSLLFKIPSLRNLSYTYPYMHDGRFKKLREVLHHYTQTITPHSTLAPSLQHSILLTAPQKTDLIAFLLTLNDKRFVFDPSNKFPKELIP
ncbi:MAG: cytochrome-c peroxidase [Aureispira sp.]